MLVGIDVGTQSLKAVVTDDQLMVRGEAAVPYSVTVPRPGWAEQDPALWLAALGPAIGRALAAAGARPTDVRGLGVSGQLDGCVATGPDGAPLAPCLIWMDRRASLPPHGRMLRERTGVVPDAMHLGAKAAWLQNALGPVTHFHQPVSYVVAALTGATVIDRALASTSMLYDLGQADYASDLLALFGVSRSALPDLGGCGDAAGRLSSSGAALTGLVAGTIVAIGTGDDYAGAFGGGVTMPGVLACTLGTAEVVGAIHREPLIDPADLLETHAFPTGGFLLENPGWLSGGAVEWLGRTLGVPDAERFHMLAAGVLPGSDDLLFIPALTGAMAPAWDARARGCFYGLTPAHGPGHLARAVLEGCAFAMRDVIQRLVALGAPVQTVRLMGGGARGPVAAQLRADVAGLPVEVVIGSDPSAIGAAACASVAAGYARSLTDAVCLVPLDTPILPDLDRHAMYNTRYDAYGRLFEQLRPMFDSLSEVPR